MIFSQIVSFFLNIIASLGYLGIFIGMTIESSFFPFPSEIILIPAGALIAKGEMSFFYVLIAGIAGSLLGAIINFYLAFFLGRKTTEAIISKYGKFLFITNNKLKKLDSSFEKHGEITTFIGRLIPGVRQLISLPAGFSKMKFIKFLFFTFLGAGLWALILVLMGYFFGSDISLIKKVIITSIILFFCLIALIIYYFCNKNKRT